MNERPRPALRGWKIPDWETRHRHRHEIANKAGCRKYVQDYADEMGLRFRGTDIWSFRVSKRTPAVAVWTPYSGDLVFPTLGETVHVHDVLCLCYEINERAGSLGLSRIRNVGT